MKKNFMPAVRKTAKSAFALSLAATMVVPTVAMAAEGDDAVTDTQAESSVPAPIKTIDFNDGLKSLQDDENFSITKTEEIYTYKTAEEREDKETYDANDLVYTGDSSNAKYAKQTVSNQPTTAYDEEKGTVLQIGKSQEVPAIYKTKSAGDSGVVSEDIAALLDEEVPVADAAIQKAFTANSEIVISNPFGSQALRDELTEYSEYDNPIEGKTWTNKYNRQRYQPIWNKGLTVSYWIKVPVDEEGKYKPSSVLRWELDDQIYYQVDDYAKHLACTYIDAETPVKKAEFDSYTEADKLEYYGATTYEEAIKKEESKVLYGSDYYFKYDAGYIEAEPDEDGAPVPVLYSGSAGYQGPVYDARFIDGTQGAQKSAYYQFNKEFIRGYYETSDGNVVAQLSELVGSHTKNYYNQYYSLDMKLDPENPTSPSKEIDASMVRRAVEDGEMQIDTDDSIFWVPDNNLGINMNPNATTSYGEKAGMHNADCFFMNSWQEGQETDPQGNGTYQSAYRVALSPVSSLDEDGIEGNGIKNGNAGKWHQVTVTLQNDWVEFYVDGEKAGVNDNYSMRGLTWKRDRSFKRLNKGTGLRYGWGSEKGAINFSYGNYVARLFMDWMTDEEATLHIGGAGDYAIEYAQATQSCEFSIDDLKFYGQLLTEDQIQEAYKSEAAELLSNKEADVVGNFADMKNVKDASVDAEAPVAGTATIEGKSVDSVTLAENKKNGTSTAAQLVNPFAGKKLEGATIAYWVKQDDANRTTYFTFMDEPKDIVNEKAGVEGTASSVLYIQDNGIADYTEGYSDSTIATKLKNTFYTGVSSTTVTEKDLLDKTAADWQYITVTVNNAGIKYYVNGELVESATQAGPRFLDGYFQRLDDEKNVKKKYGIYGGTDNQGSTTLMSFLTADDTAIYLGCLPESGSDTYNKTAGATFAGIKTVDQALTDAQVKELYANRFNGNSGNDKPGPSGIKGDVNLDGEIGLDDVQLALQLYLDVDEAKSLTDVQRAAADFDDDGDLSLTDIQSILQLYLQ